MYYIYLLTFLGYISLGVSQAPSNTSIVGRYKFDVFDTRKSYNEARAVCDKRGSWLVEIKDEEIERAIENLTTLAVWIGLSRHSGEWKWGNRSSLRYKNWENGSPSVKNSSKCVVKKIKTRTWKNLHCGQHRCYVCQSDNDYLPYDLSYVASPKKKFTDAKAACKSGGKRLVEVKTRSLKDEIERKLSEKHPGKTKFWYYTSGNDIVTEGTWLWGDGSTVYETYWKKDASNGKAVEPDGGKTENCIMVSSPSGGWVDVRCASSRPYICQSDIINGSCESRICSDRGTCGSVKYRYHCSCSVGYFGTKCEKDLIEISSSTQTVNVNKGKTASVNLIVKSYDGNVTISRESQPGGSIDSQEIDFDGTAFKTSSYQMGVHLANATYKFYASPSSDRNAYQRNATVKVIVTDQCISSPCGNRGRCTYSIEQPYYKCICTSNFEGPTCAVPKFVSRENCKYHINYGNPKLFKESEQFCKNERGSLAMIKSLALQDFLEQQFIDIYGNRSNVIELWVGGQKLNGTWHWLDGTKIPVNGAEQKWKYNNRNRMVITSYRSTIDKMFWHSKFIHQTIKGFICEKAVSDPCSSIDCINRGSCVTLGCQANCNCRWGFYGDTCARDSITITPDKTMYAAVLGELVNVRLTIESKNGPVNIEYYKSSDSSVVLGSKKNVGDTVNFFVGPLEVSKKNESYTFRATPASSLTYYHKYAIIHIGIEGPLSIVIHPKILSFPVSGSWSVVVCSSSGFPEPTATWKFDGETVTSNRSQARYQVVSGSKSRLYFTAGARDQVGLYTCFAENVVAGTKQIVNGTAFVKAPYFVPMPVVKENLNDDGTMSLQIGIPEQTNGRISCMFVIAVYNPLESHVSESKTYKREDLQKASSKSKSDLLAAGDEYIAMALKSSEILYTEDKENMLTKKLGDGSTSSCDIAISNINRRKRDVSSTEITARNRALDADTKYRSFVVITTPGENDIYFQSSEVFQFKTPSDSSTTGPHIGGVIGALVGLCVIAGIVGTVYIKRKRASSRTNGITPYESTYFENRVSPVKVDEKIGSQEGTVYHHDNQGPSGGTAISPTASAIDESAYEMTEYEIVGRTNYDVPHGSESAYEDIGKTFENVSGTKTLNQVGSEYEEIRR